MGQSRETTELQWRFPLFFCWQWPPRLPPRQTPRLRPTLTSCTEDTMATALATVMDTDTPTHTDTTVRGRPRLSPRLRLTLTSCTWILRTWTRLWLWIRLPLHLWILWQEGG